MTSSSRFGRRTGFLRQRSHKRRPAGISRRQKKQLGFESLEDRRVMSADNPLATLQGAVDDSIGIQVTSYSSSSVDGQLAILQNELYWNSLLNSSGAIDASLRAIPTDPLVGDQWHLINVGQQVGNPDFQNIFGIPGEDINVAPVWNDGIFGNDVIVAVIEPEGFFQLDHPDLAANVSPDLSFDGLGFNFDQSHPTSVAGILGAVADNGLGGTGVAPGVELVPISLGLDSLTQAALWRFTGDNGIDVTNNSWGPAVNRGIAGPDAIELLGIRDSIIFGRPDENGNPLGVIHVFASGNDAGSPFDFGFQSQGTWDSADYDGYVASRYTIGVSGVDHDGFYNNTDGTVTNYPEAGTSVLVAAPTGSFAFSNIGNDTGIGSGITTTDLTGEDGYNGSDNTGFPFGDRDFLADIDYTSRFNGTSAAAPMVSGVIALMLEANPNLSWRDVQEIMVRSARQNAEFETPFATGVGSTQNTWIQNQMPLFHDPDLWDPTVNPFTQTFTPTLDPFLTDAGTYAGPNEGPLAGPVRTGQFLNSVSSTGVHYAPTPQTLTNGAGYTISQGKGVHGELIGFAHGTVDAELAVQLAEQWHTKNQALPSELTYTSFINPEGGFFIPVPAAEVGNVASGFQYVPGGLGGGGGFIGFWNEYFADDPFANNPLFNNRGGYLELTVPDNNLMTIENVEVKISTLDDGVDETELLDNLRVTLVSPTGTFHELNHFFVDYPGAFSHQNANEYTFEASPALASVDTTPGNPLVATFTSNRSWGERSDNAIIFDPTTAEPVSGNLINRGWQLHFENYSLTNDVGITGVEVVWHGSPVNNANTQRLQGLIGIDDNQDDLFNFSRVTTVDSSFGGITRFGDVENIIDPTHESMAPNITVFAHRDVNSNGILDESDILVDQFVTGHDGNYYFDLVPNDYIISLDSESLQAQGFDALDDSITSAGFLKDYQSQWAINSDFFNVWDYDANLEVPINSTTDAPFSFIDPATVLPVQYHVNHINFLLDPGAPAAPQVDFTGTIFADTNGDGEFNEFDVTVAGVGVFGDVNRNGEFDPGEVLATTDADGNYSLTVPLLTESSVMNVGVRPPANWTASNPSGGFQAFFVEQGDSFDNVDFFVMPPAGVTAGDGSVLSGIILGSVFNDVNENGAREAGEVGVQNLTVYIDMNDSGSIDAGDIVSQTNTNGAYSFAGLSDGDYTVRLDLTPGSGILQTFPSFNFPQVVTIISGGTANGTEFGVTNGGGGGGGPSGNLDYGDLPDTYGTTLASNGARHTQGSYFLGSLIDTETDGVPGMDADGDDMNFVNDEDGVVLLSGDLASNTTGTIQVTASRSSGFLQMWMDFDNNGTFSASEQVVVNKLLPLGTSTVDFAIPAISGSQVYTRVRYGEFGLASVGPANLGEVEDYVYDAVVPESAPLIVSSDFDSDGMVTGLDFLRWQLNTGMASGASVSEGDANQDGAVNIVDRVHWELQYGDNTSSDPGSAAVTVPGMGDFDQDGIVSGLDLLAWQVGVGTQETATLSDGDGNFDGNVDGGDLAAWEQSYGDVYSQTGGSGGGGALSFASSVDTSKSGSKQQTTPSATLAGDSANTSAVGSSVISTGVGSDVLGFVASRLEDAFARYHRLDRHAGFGTLTTRLENHLLEKADRFENLKLEFLPELDNVVDGLFDRLEDKFDRLPSDPSDAQEDEALEGVFEETAEWRFA